MRHIVLVYEKVERRGNTLADFSDYNRDKTNNIIQSAQQSHDSYHSLKPILKTDRSDFVSVSQLRVWRDSASRRLTMYCPGFPDQNSKIRPNFLKNKAKKGQIA
ncbi:hypothetical protein AVEN_1005-1 [Araneus ventricosus]|uniref:Uncharacterized protein n=1 Tax=Araneus ventricosus TaxID=182803 RepID=A0A4Y2RI52_ARAVE|nr:hypothetical protein AVEN_1005-1 [Araneus ventricosus]